jgi:hypothetical protein
VPFRKLSDAKSAAETLAGDIKLESFQPQWIRSEGRRILLLQFDVSAESANEGWNYQGEATFLAAYSAGPTMKLLDVMDIKTDRFTSFWEKPSVLQLNSRNDAVLVYSEHSNAGESFNDFTMLFLDRNRIRTITNLFIFNTQGCGVGFTETPSFRAISDASQKYPKITVTVKVKKDADPPECERATRGFTRYYQMIYSWNAAKAEYNTRSAQLAAFDKFNGNRF